MQKHYGLLHIPDTTGDESKLPAWYSAAEVDARISRLEQICAAAYQLAGVVGAPVRFLDALSRFEGDIDSLLPVSIEECDEFTEAITRAAHAEAVISTSLLSNARPMEPLGDSVGQFETSCTRCGKSIRSARPFKADVVYCSLECAD